MKNKADNPGVKIPPPLIYVLIFVVSVLIEKAVPISFASLRSTTFRYAGAVLILSGLLFMVPAVSQFIRSKNTLVPVRPANSLQTNGVYSVSRNPMYLGWLILYIGLIPIVGNWWSLIFAIIVIVAVTYLVIKPEEQYLRRRFGESYLSYTSKVRRWI